jgi:hypothetical protein
LSVNQGRLRQQKQTIEAPIGSLSAGITQSPYAFCMATVSWTAKGGFSGTPSDSTTSVH